jgi:hypothetical protein
MTMRDIMRTKNLFFLAVIGLMIFGCASVVMADTQQNNTSINVINLTASSIISPIGRCATVTVAASNSPLKEKIQADYICDGVDDQVKIQKALNSVAPLGGKVLLCEGNYYISRSICPPTKGVGYYRAGDMIILEGMSNGAVLTWSGSKGGYVFSIPDAWNFQIRDISINGNSKAGNGLLIYGTSASTSQRNIFKDIIFTSCGVAISIGAGNGDNMMSAIDSFENIQIDSCGDGIRLNSFNADQLNFNGGIINGCTNAINSQICGLVEFYGTQIVNCDTILRKNITESMTFVYLEEENNKAFLTNENAVASSNGILSFENCLLQSPISITNGSFPLISSMNCIINSNINFLNDARWLSHGDKIVGTVATGTYGLFSQTHPSTMGTANVTGSAKSVTVTHAWGNPVVIMVTPKQLGQGYCAVTARDAATFTISFQNAPGASTWGFDWIVEY